MTSAGARRRLLFLLPFAPRLRGLHGGARATGQLIAALARRHDITALFLAEPGEPPLEDEMVAACVRLEGVERRLPGSGLPAKLGPKLGLLRGIPTWASEVAERPFAELAARVAAEWGPDVVQLEYPVMAQYLPALDSCPAPRVLVDHEASVRDLREWRGPLAGVTGALDARAWRRFELRAIEGVQAVVVFTDRDRRKLEALGARTPVVTIPLGTPVPDSPLDPVGAAPPAVLFVGNFEHPANTDAALWLGTAIFPPLGADRPDVRLTIVGPSPPPDVVALAARGARVTGRVPDVAPYLDEAAVVAAPIRVGGGMRVKVLEALAAGKAVVATPLAVEGLDLVSGEQVEIAEGEDDFRSALAALLDDEAARRGLGGRARAWASRHLGWGASAERYERLYDELLRVGTP